MKKYYGFTLIEMLIVMGIIIILMAAGIAGGRFALQRANRIQKQSAVDNIEQALWGYYSDKRRYPAEEITGAPINPETLLTSSNYLADYIDAGQFDGGADGTFYYFVSENAQEYVVCGSIGGFNDVQGLGIYCSGNGITGTSSVLAVIFENAPPPGNIYPTDHDDYNEIDQGDAQSDWNGEFRRWGQ